MTYPKYNDRAYINHNTKLGSYLEERYNPSVLKHRHLPELNKLSLFTAVILLAYALARYIDLPARELSLQLPGIYLSVSINIRTAVTLLSALITASGADWLFRSHPEIGQTPTYEHWLLPALTAWVIGIPLFQISIGLTWWFGFLFAGVMLVSVLIAEYITIDPDDIRYSVAASGLTALSFGLFLTLVISLRFAGYRLFLLLPAVTVAAWLVCLRTYFLRSQRSTAFVFASLVAIITAQITAAMHYLPISAISYGLLLLGPTYTLTSFFANMQDGDPIRQAATEPSIIFAVILGFVLWIG